MLFQPTVIKKERRVWGTIAVAFCGKKGPDETGADRAGILELEEQVSGLQRQKEALLKGLDLLTARYRD